MNYYLYRHIRLDTDEVFYVGVGQKYKNFTSYTTEYRRAFEYKYNRTKFWKNIINKTKYEVEILMESDDYDFILRKEIEFIKLYGRRDLDEGTLVNLNNGGGGNKGYKYSQEQKEKLSIKMKKFLLEGKLDKFINKIKIYQYDLEGNFVKEWESIHSAEKFYNTKGAISHSLKSKSMSSMGAIWSYIKQDKIENLQIKKTKKLLTTKTNQWITRLPIYQYSLTGVFIKEWGTIKQAADYYKIYPETIKRCANYKVKSAGGFQWSLCKEDKLEIVTTKKRNNKIIQMKNIKNGIVLREFNHITFALEFLNKANAKRGIQMCLAGKLKNSTGYIWQYKDDTTK